MRVGVLPFDASREPRFGFSINASAMYAYYSHVASGEPLNGTWRGRRVRGADMSYRVPSMRLDSLWRRELGRRRISFLKVDVDRDWKAIGMEGLLREKAFAILVSAGCALPGYARRVHSAIPWPLATRVRSARVHVVCPCAYVQSIEVDGHWGGTFSPWNVTSTDQLAWLASTSGYDTFLKVSYAA